MPAGEYVDYASGTRDDRPQYQALLAAARKRHIDMVLVWRYDRFARSTQALVQALNEFHSLGWILSPIRKTSTRRPRKGR